MNQSSRISQEEINKNALAKPTPGDLWRERVMIFICLVVDANEHSVLVQRKTRPYRENQYVIDFDTAPELLTLKAFRELVRHADMNLREEDRPLLLNDYKTGPWVDKVRLMTSSKEADETDEYAGMESKPFVDETVYRKYSFVRAMQGLRKPCMPPPQLRKEDGYHWLRHTTISTNYKLAKWCAKYQAWYQGPGMAACEMTNMSWHSKDTL